MTKKKKNNPRSQSSMTSFPDPETFREQAEQKAKTVALPDLDNMTHEEIRQMVHEMKVKQIEADLQIEHLRSGEENDDQASLFSIVIENMLDMVALTDMEGNFTFAGKSHEVLGYEPGFLIGKNVMDFVHPEDLPYIMKEFGELLESGLPRKVEFRYRCKDGTYIWLETIRNFLGDESGIPHRIVFNSRDITERKQAEEDLAKNKIFLESILNSIQDGLSIIDSELNIKYTNPVMEQWYAESMPLVGRKCYVCYHKNDKPCNPCPTLRCFESGETESDYVPGPPRSAVVWIELFSHPMKNSETGEIMGVIEFVRDITEQKQAEEALRKSEELLTASERLSKTGGWEWNVETQTMYWTKENYRIHDFTPEAMEPGSTEHINRSVECYEPEDRPIILAAFQRCVEEGQSYDLEFPFTTAKGRRLWIRTIAHPVSENGKVIRVIGNIMDITERKRAEEEREKLQTQLNQAQKMESVGRLAGGVAHDFNNKLTIINGYAEMAIDMMDPSDPLHETIQEILTAGKQSATIVRQLLAFARKQTISPVQLDLNDTISNMLKMLQSLIGENIGLEWHPGKNLWPIEIDPSQVDQIMANLSLNARDAISDVGKLTIETKNTVVDEDYCKSNQEAIPGRYVMLVVSDDGCGMEKEVKDQLFEPFFTTKDVGEGSGLGLPTVYGIVKQNNGFINVYSEPGEGTVFKIYLPRHEEHESPVSEHLKEFAGQRPTGSETILLVEDDRSVLHMGRVLLGKLGYIVLTAEAPDDALQLAEAYDGKIHLLITDVIMPEMNGRDLAIRINLLRPEIKTIYISSYAESVIAQLGMLDKGVHYIQKPFSIEKLAVKVRGVLEQE